MRKTPHRASLSAVLFQTTVIIVLLSLITGCNQDMINNSDTKDDQQEYRWSVTESAPKGYVVQILDGYFEAADGFKKGIPTRALVDKGWGKGRSWIAEGRESLPIPKRFELTWFSYREDKFYYASFDLPIERLEKLFTTAMIKPYSGTEQNYGVFTLGLAPEGFITVWLTGGNHQWVVFKGKAQEIEDIPWSAVFNNPDFSKEQIMRETIEESIDDAKGSPHLNDPTYWQRLHNESYNYTININSYYTPYSISADFLDHTSHVYFSDDQHWDQDPLSLPKNITFAYIFPKRISAVSIQNIDPEEVRKAFTTLGNSGNQTAHLVVSVTGDLEHSWNYDVSLHLEIDDKKIPIKNFNFKRRDNTEMLPKIKSNSEFLRYINHTDKPASP